MRLLGFEFQLAAIATTLILTPIPVCDGEEQQPAAPTFRRYDDGPLTAADFRAPIPKRRVVNNVFAVAYTRAEIRLDYRYSYRIRNGTVTAKVDRIEIFAIVHRNKSWNALPNNKKLMDHEQGHFDIAHAAALKARLELAQQARAGKPLQATAARPEDAVRAVKKKVQSFLSKYIDAVRNGHRDYDRLTRHGEIDEAQERQRAQQKEAIRSLTAKLKQAGAH
ncbi:MAG: DUF922 domain-containing protein [Planctomycetes bacterium]|nr:DUF922 domain-containing protein [Planctomycetota bacterium]